jgi:hypothetical protein
VKFLRTVRFDASDDHVFARAARPGEWAVSGAFEFADAALDALAGKTRQAFTNGFLGLSSFGRSTFALVGDIQAEDRAAIEAALARHFVDAYGAPDLETAQPAAREEVLFVTDLCAGKPVNTVFAVSRELVDGHIREEYREISPPREADHARVWDIVDDA